MSIYDIGNISDILSNNIYPGRGIIIGKTPDSKKAVFAYFIMGRSENSRNRIFTEKDGAVFTEPFDASKVEDPSLIIYAAVRSIGKKIIVTNGDQTDTIYELMQAGQSFEESLRTREFEPDAPNYTPRISGIMNVKDGEYDFALSILKSNHGDPSSCQRFTFTYENPKAGEGYFIHTYMGDGNPLPSYEGEPTQVTIPGDIDAFTNGIWAALNADNKVSLFTRYIEIATGNKETRILNKNIKE
jgi:IMP cyclohydrolase